MRLRHIKSCSALVAQCLLWRFSLARDKETQSFIFSNSGKKIKINKKHSLVSTTKNVKCKRGGGGGINSIWHISLYDPSYVCFHVIIRFFSVHIKWSHCKKQEACFKIKNETKTWHEMKDRNKRWLRDVHGKCTAHNVQGKLAGIYREMHSECAMQSVLSQITVLDCSLTRDPFTEHKTFSSEKDYTIINWAPIIRLIYKQIFLCLSSKLYCRVKL